MGYPMTYRRVIYRNQLHGTYPSDWRERSEMVRSAAIAGDLRRLEQDQRDGKHLRFYAEQAGITVEQAHIVLSLFFEADR